MEEVILSLKGIEKSFGEGDVLAGIDLDVYKGEFVTLLGSSGCGKTTTLRIIAGLETPDSGAVILNGQDVTALAPEQRNVNTVFQNYALFPHMNVEKNVAYGLRVRGVSKVETQDRVRQMLRLVQMEGFAKRMPAQLSGGQRQRIAIARALCCNPALLLLDEPLGALDLQLRRQMQVELKRLQERLGITFIYITHDQEEALGMSDRIAVMQGGRFEQLGTPEDIFERPATRYVAQFIGQSTILEADVESVEGGMAQLTCPDGRVRVSLTRGQLRPGEAATLCIRNERMHLSVKPVEGFSLAGTVNLNRYTGGALVTHVTLPSGLDVAATSSGRMEEAPAVGSRAYLYWDAAQASVVGGASHGRG